MDLQVFFATRDMKLPIPVSYKKDNDSTDQILMNKNF